MFQIRKLMMERDADGGRRLSWSLHVSNDSDTRSSSSTNLMGILKESKRRWEQEEKNDSVKKREGEKYDKQRQREHHWSLPQFSNQILE